jgi:hypothetical protein
VRDGDFARAGGGDDSSFRSGLCNEVAQGIAVVGSVGNDTVGLHVRKQVCRGRDVVRLSAGDDEAQRSTLGVGEDMDFGGQSSSGTPQSLPISTPVRRMRSGCCAPAPSASRW